MAAASNARCRRHGTRLDPSGGCALCRDERAGRPRLARLWLAIPAALVAVAAVWWIGRDRAPAEQPASPGASSRPEASSRSEAASRPRSSDRMPGRIRVRALGAEVSGSEQSVEAGEPGPAEDRSLAAPPPPPPVTSVEPPPEPPRAPIDPEPAAPDDPRDFDVPAGGAR